MAREDTQVDLSLVLACYNEAEHIEQSVLEIIKVLDAARWSYEIIFVDDVSRDNTRELILELIGKFPDHRMSYIFHERNTGRGGAVSDGFRVAKGEFVGYIDIDLEVHARYISSFLLALQDGASMCVAERIYRVQVWSLFRHLMSRVYALLVRRVLILPYRDTEAGYKFARRSVILDVMQYVENQGWFWDTEVMFHAHRLGYKVVEIPCLFTRRPDKTSTVKPVADTMSYLRDLMMLASRYRLKKATGLGDEVPDQTQND
jgi:dolichol-phosphate mannosyltransferase